jgi:diguanylate cyclase (GGDEF)-like protein
MVSERIKELEEQLIAAEDGSKKKIDALNSLAAELYEQDPNSATRLAEQALLLSRTQDIDGEYIRGSAEALITLGEIASNSNAYGLAITRLMEAYTLLNGKLFPDLLANASHTIGWAHSSLGNYTEAFEFLEQALNICRDLLNREKEAEVLTSLGTVYSAMGNHAQAMENFQQALKLQDSQRVTRARGVTLNNLAYAQVTLGVNDESVENALAGIKILEELGLRYLETTALDTLGLAYFGRDELEKAEDALNKSLVISEQAGYESLELESIKNLGKVYIQQGRNVDAISHFESAVKKAEVRQLNKFIYQYHEILADLYEKKGDLKNSLQHYKQFHSALDLTMVEAANYRIENLKVLHQVEKKQREAEMLWLQNQSLKTEINERQRERGLLEKLATTDPLTSLYNRQYFFTLGEYELEKARKNGIPLSVIFMDIDHFKTINDTYGHSVGDKTLIELARLLLSFTHNVGISCRYGGEEFLVLVPNMKLAAIQALAERIRLAVSITKILNEKNEIGLSASMGVVQANCMDVDLSAVLARADQALYRAKSAGRNCVSL